MDTFTQEGE